MKTSHGISFASALIATILLSGSALSAPIAISYLTHWSPETVAKLEAAAKDFTAANPDVTITVRAVPFGDLLTTIRSQGSSADSPTIASIYDLWLPELARDKLIEPAPDASARDIASNWPAGVASAASVGGKYYGYPNEIDVYALNYNKKLFSEAGITAPPATWAELEAAAEKITKKEGDHITRQGFGMINSWAAGVVHPFASLLVSNGGDLIVDGKPAFDSKAAAGTFKLYEDFIKKGYTDPSMGTADANTTGPFLDNFVSGNTGMIIMANWWESALKGGLGDKFSDIGTAPIPVGPDGDKARSISYSWLTVVNTGASAEQREAAWKFLAWLNGPTSGKAGASAMSDILLSMGILPSRSSDVTAHAKDLDREFLAGYVKTLADAKAFPVVLGGQEFSEALQQVIEGIQFGRVSAEEAQANAQTDSVSILERAAQ